MAAVRHFGFKNWKSELPTVFGGGANPNTVGSSDFELSASRTKFRDRSNQPINQSLLRRPPSWIFKIRNFNGRKDADGQRAPSCQISYYGDRSSRC